MPRAWKIADVPPLLKAPTIDDINKDIRPICLTSTLSKVAEGFVIDMDRLSVIDPSQFGFIPGSCTTFALISMFHQWLRATDAGIAHSDLVRFYCSVIRSILEYACQVFHCNLPLYLSEEIERIQRRALRVIFPDCSYSEGLAKAGLTTLYDRRSTLCKELFSDIDTQGNHKLSHLLPVRSQQNYNLRSTRAFAAPVCKTNRFRDSFISSHCM